MLGFRVIIPKDVIRMTKSLSNSEKDKNNGKYATPNGKPLLNPGSDPESHFT